MLIIIIIIQASNGLVACRLIFIDTSSSSLLEVLDISTETQIRAVLHQDIIIIQYSHARSSWGLGMQSRPVFLQFRDFGIELA